MATLQIHTRTETYTFSGGTLRIDIDGDHKMPYPTCLIGRLTELITKAGGEGDFNFQIGHSLRWAQSGLWVCPPDLRYRKIKIRFSYNDIKRCGYLSCPASLDVTEFYVQLCRANGQWKAVQESEPQMPAEEERRLYLQAKDKLQGHLVSVYYAGQKTQSCTREQYIKQWLMWFGGKLTRAERGSSTHYGFNFMLKEGYIRPVGRHYWLTAKGLAEIKDQIKLVNSHLEEIVTEKTGLPADGPAVEVSRHHQAAGLRQKVAQLEVELQGQREQRRRLLALDWEIGQQEKRLAELKALITAKKQSRDVLAAQVDDTATAKLGRELDAAVAALNKLKL